MDTVNKATGMSGYVGSEHRKVCMWEPVNLER